MMTIDSNFDQELDNVQEELRLIHCVQVLETSQDPQTSLSALNYLRKKATEHHDTEAKTKLSILYSEPSPFIKQDATESTLWSRSVFDKQLSHALAMCSSALQTSDPSTTHCIEACAKQRQDPAMCYLAGLLLSKGIGFQQDLKQGVDLLQFAVTEGRVAEAGCELGRICGDRYPYSLHQPAESMRWFHAAFECGSTQAVVDLAYGFFEGNVPKDDARALRYAKDGALLNDKYCQYIVGHLYLKGRGVEADAQEAVKWLHASAQQGFAVAIEEEASVYMFGHGNVKQDYEKAHQCCIQASAANIPFCQARLGDMYRNAWSVEQDYQKAFQYYQNAASQSDIPYPYAQHMLGEMFLNGEGVPKDYAVAKEWFQIASTQGYEPSRSRLQQIELIESNQALQQKKEKSTDQQEKRSSRWSLNFFKK